MAVFRPRDHRGIILEAGTDQPAGPAPGRQLTLGQVMNALVIIAALFVFAVQRPDALFLVLILAACLYGLSRLPFRARLTIELATTCFLLILAAWVWRPPFYVHQAERTEELARLCRVLAGRADSERSRVLFRKAAEYDRRAQVPRLQGMWYGLLRSATKEDLADMTDRELILELGLLEVLDRHEKIAEEMGILLRWRRP